MGEMSNTGSMDDFLAEQPFSLNVDLMMEVIMSITAVVGVPANAFVIWLAVKKSAIYFDKMTNMYTVCRCFGDLLFVLGAVVLVPYFNTDKWVFGNAVCKLVYATSHASVFASNIFLTALCIDWYSAVMGLCSEPARFWRLKIATGAIWLLTCVVALPFMFVYGVSPFSGECILYNYSWFIGMINYCIFAALAVPGIINWLLMVRVFIRNKSTSVATLMNKDEEVLSAARRLVFAFTVVYTVCLLPYGTFQLVRIVCNLHGKRTWQLVVMLNSLLYVNSAMNPIVYLAVRGNMREVFCRNRQDQDPDHPKTVLMSKISDETDVIRL